MRARKPGPGISFTIGKAMKVVKTVLSNTRNPQIASSDHSHTYEDKYALAETITALGMTSVLNTLEQLGMEKPTLQRLVKIVKDEQESVTMRISAKDKCEFLREDEIKIESPSLVEETSLGSILKSSTSRKIVTKVKQYHWRVEIEYTIHVFCGTDSTPDGEKSAVLKSNKVSCDITTQGSKERPLSSETLDSDVSLTWLLQHVNKETLNADFSIDRDLESCRTPARNQNIKEASESLQVIKKWFSEMNGYFKWRDEELERFTDPTDNIPHLSNSIKANQIFVPVLPIFDTKKGAITPLEGDDGTTSTTPSKSSPVLSSEDIKKMLELQSDSMSKAIDTVSSRFSLDSTKGKASRQLMTSTEATIVLLSDYIGETITMWLHGVDHIEQMLYSQLHDAIGKEVDSNDLSEFVRFHNQRLFSDTYAPEEFCYAIRRPEHYPDGMISIEEMNSDKVENILTFTRKLENNGGEYPMYIPINSATSIEFKGDMFLHAWLLQRFQDEPTFQLAARARQFSSFMLLVGKLSGSDTFEPEHGIILKNQDEVLIPLLLSEIPSAKEFKDAIESLSPEQQRFAESFRNMKLSSSIFGVCVVQLKPQLELLLGLPETSLTKEIRLTQDLLNLFIDYQIPSDLLSYDGPEDASHKEKVDIVKQHVKNVLDMINVTREEELEQAKEQAKMSYYSAQQYRECEEESVGDSWSRSRYRDDERAGGAPVCAVQSSRAVKSNNVRKFRKKSSQMPVMYDSIPMPMPKSQMQPLSTIQKQMMPDTTNAKCDHDNNSNPPSLSNLQQQQLGNGSIDLTAIPKHLDQKFEKFSKDETYGGALRSTTIKTGDNWTKKSKPNLLSEMKSETMIAETQKTERNRTFDLLDALSRSGSLALQDAELHVMVASSHCFEKSVVDTVVKDNINPIEKIERSNLIVAQVVHDVRGGIADLLRNEDDMERIGKASPLLLQDIV